MPRNKALLKKRAGGAAMKKIVIKPFQKPPSLPPNFYEQTSRELLEGTMNVIFEPNSSNNSSNISLQNSYQQVVNLVSHQYGPRLYGDLVQTLQQVCERYVLPADQVQAVSNAASSSSSSSSASASAGHAQLLGYIQTQYQTYVDYLLLCKHVFLPLDSSHAWNPASGQGVVRRAGGAAVAAGGGGGGANSAVIATTTTTTEIVGVGASSGTTMTMATMIMGLWQVGLEQFRKRLLEFRLDDLIYEKWWESLKIDWDDMLPLDQQTLLQSTLFMWQDLAMLSDTLSRRVEPDLIHFFQTKALELKTGSTTGVAAATASTEKYSSTAAITYCYSKWMHVAYHWNRFLPKSTSISLLENYLFKPHLQPEWLLNPPNFDAILEESFALSSQSTLGFPSGRASLSTSTTTPTSNAVSTTSPVQQLWMLAGRLPGGHKQVGSAIAQFARNRGLSLMTSMGENKVSNKQRIGDLLVLQRQLQVLLSQLPRCSEYCILKPVWEDVTNPTMEHYNGETMVADALAKYIDGCLKDNKRQQQTDDKWAEAIISGVFCHLQAKDIFEGFYKKDLAKRLIGNRVVSMDVERHFVSLFKAECGAAYTAKMEGMFQDMDSSREIMSRYKQAQYQTGSYDSEKLELDISCLTTGFWPVYPQYPNLILPKELLAPQEQFTEYYKSKYQGRRMTWQYAIGQVVVRFKPRKSGPKYELLVSPTQALVLLQFNDNEEMTLPEIMAAVGLDDREDAELIVLGLSLGKEGTRILQKKDHDAEAKKKTRTTVHDQDTFLVQSTFKSNARRIRIGNILMKETKEEREKTVEAVSRDRLYYIDAVLVRIMKARKTILHQQLIPQVLEQLKFPAQPADVKKRIEVLIEREYMERDTTDRSRYTYLA